MPLDQHLCFAFKWIHGQLNNPVYEFARDNKLLEDGYDSFIDLKIFQSSETSQLPDLDAFKQLTVGEFTCSLQTSIEISKQ